MRLVAALLAPLLITAAAVAFALPAHAAAGKNCSDFATQTEAQSYFESQGGSASNNVDGLDANSDGVACESLPAGDGPTSPTPSSTPTSTDTTPPVVTTTSPVEEEPTETSTPQPQPAVTVESVLGLVADFDCDNGFSAQTGSLFDQTRQLSEQGTSLEDIGRINDALSAKLETVNYCFGEASDAPAAPIDPDVVVSDIDDDDSTATVSGGQVREVPEGSIATGGA